MNKKPAGRQDVSIPPAKYFGASPTYNQWCKLSIADTVYRLHEEKGFEGQNVLFYHNHPVQYAYLVGIIVSIEAASSGPTMITLDDSSGACIDLVVKRDKSSDDPGHTKTEKLTISYTTGPMGPILNPIKLSLDGQHLQPGLLVKAKGTFSSFRGIRQIDLKRLAIVKNTTEEIAAWQAEGKSRKDIFSKPWILTEADRKRIDATIRQGDAQAKLEEARQALKKRQRSKKLEVQQRRKAKREEEEEQQRQIVEAKMNEGALV
ncbi:Hypothetical protein D9617_2g059010 [Elsinoe fawcettii]|nr:Hypothetical protein D9617_2g059010 [Elsinoe fawcettii]